MICHIDCQINLVYDIREEGMMALNYIAKDCLALFLVFFIVFLGIAFCQKESEFKTVKQDGIAIALNPDHPVPEKNSPKDVLFKEKFTIGSAEGNPEYIFIPMGEGCLMVMRDGIHGQNAFVDIFDSSGRFIIEKKLDFPIECGICKGGHFYTIFTDADGFPFVKCYGYTLE